MCLFKRGYAGVKKTNMKRALFIVYYTIFCKVKESVLIKWLFTE